jgi:succinate-semialdehyde dehydrogenase/glutarate-semialdehyde dehydrogenase
VAAPEAGVDQRVIHSVNPATLEPVGEVRAAAPEEVQEAVAEARLAQERWARRSGGERRALLAAVAQRVLDRADEIAATITAETGKPLVESFTNDVFVALENLCWTARNAERVLGPEPAPFPQLYLRHKRAWILHEPLGVVALISPWNLPFAIPLSQAAAAVAAGNAVVVKPSELAPLSGAWVERCFDEAGAPEGLVRAVHGTGDVGAALARARGVAKIFFTGSVEAAREIAAGAGANLRPVVLELGGKDPMLVFEDADLGRAVGGALWGSFANCGQLCAGVERIYVAAPVYDRFLVELVERTRSLRIGRGEDLTTELGPLISAEQRERVESLVADALEQGATAATGAARPDTGLPGWFYEPTVLVGVRREAGLEQEEVFGPVVSVAPFAGEDEAVRAANDSRFGLAASVWTSDPGRARRVAQRLDAGTVWTNDVAYSYGAGQAPWGGRKSSGFGRTHSRFGLYECSQTKFVDFDSGRVPVPWWYPYGEAALDGFRGLTEILFREGVRPRLAEAWRHRRGLVHLAGRYVGR